MNGRRGRLVLLVALVLVGWGTVPPGVATGAFDGTASVATVGTSNASTAGPENAQTAGTASMVTAGGATDAPTVGVSTDAPTTRTATALRRPGDESERTTTTDVEVTGGTLPVDADRVWERVEAMHGTNVVPPVVSVDDSDPSPTEKVLPPEFLYVLGAEPARPNPPTPGVNGRVSPRGRVTVTFADAPSETVEQVLAHEFAHVVQQSADVLERLPDGNYLLAKSTIEGGAEYVEDVYARRYQDHSSLAATRRAYRNGAAFQKWALAPYYFGAQYVRSRVSSPRELSSVYANPPTTTEQVLHDYPPGAEPAKTLSVTVDETGEWRARPPGRKGELFVRVALTTELGETHAARAAAGWGNDALVRFRRTPRGRDAGYAWVLRWDDSTNATEFRHAFETMLDRQATRTDSGWRRDDTAYRVERVSDETVAVLAGHPQFAANVAAEGSRDDVAITVDSNERRPGDARGGSAFENDSERRRTK